MNIELNYTQKLIGLCLLKALPFNDAANAFSEALKLKQQEAVNSLQTLQKRTVLVSNIDNGILEKIGNSFILHKNDERVISITSEFMAGCSYVQRVSLEKAMQFCKERATI